MTTLLFVEHGNGQIKDGTLKALSAAKDIGAPVHVLVLGSGSKTVAEAAAKLDGIEKVLVAEDAAYDHDLAEPVGALIASIAEPYDTIIASASTTGKNVLPRVAAPAPKRSPCSSQWARRWRTSSLPRSSSRGEFHMGSGLSVLTSSITA